MHETGAVRTTAERDAAQAVTLAASAALAVGGAAWQVEQERRLLATMPAIDRAAATWAKRYRLTGGADAAQEVGAQVVAELLEELRGGAEVDTAALPLARRCGAVASRMRREQERETPAGDAADAVGETAPTADLQEQERRQRAAVGGRRAVVAGMHRADVYGVSDAARDAMRDPADVYAHDRHREALAAAMAVGAGQVGAYVPETDTRRDAWAPIADAPADAFADAYHDLHLFTTRQASGVRLNPCRAGRQDAAAAARQEQRRADAVRRGDTPAPIAEGAMPGDVKAWDRVTWAQVAPVASEGERRALARAAKTWAARCRSAASGWADRDAAAVRAALADGGRRARVAASGRGVGAFYAASRARVSAPSDGTIREHACPAAADDAAPTGKERRRVLAQVFGPASARLALVLSRVGTESGADAEGWSGPTGAARAATLAAYAERRAAALAGQYRLQDGRRVVRALTLLLRGWGTGDLEAATLLRRVTA